MTKERTSFESSQLSQADQSRQTVVQRPTEGQLRWAQFHYRRRAHRVREFVNNNLYQTPATIYEVPGAVSEDGNSTESSGNDAAVSAARRRRRPKPKISRGRRALLRVSQRHFRERSEMIHRHGFQRTAENCAASSSSSEEGEEDALASIFAEEAVWKKRRRKKRHTNDRGKRFDQAFHAFMMNVAAARQPQFASVETPAKIWTRPAETPMINVNYDAMRQMGIPTTSRKSTMMQPSGLPMDRGASWLVHLPKTEKTSNETRKASTVAFEVQVDENVPNDNQLEGPASPVRQRFRDIVTGLQMKSDPKVFEPLRTTQLPTMRLQKYFAQMQETDEKKEEGSPLPATRLDFQRVQDGIQNIQKRAQTDEEDLQNLLLSMDSVFLQEMEALNPGVKERLKALYLRESSPTVKQLARIIETPTEKKGPPQGLVQSFVARLEKASKKENLISADGKLHKPTFAKLLNQYLMEAKGEKISPRRRQPLVDSLVSKFQESEDTDSIIDQEGHLDKPVLANLVTRYLAELTGQDENLVRDAEDWESLQTEEYRVRPDFIRDSARSLREQVKSRQPRGEEEWCMVTETSFIASLPPNSSVAPPKWAVQRLAERCAALVPEAWDQINTIEEVIEMELDEARKIHREGFLPPTRPVSAGKLWTPREKHLKLSPHVQQFVRHLEQTANVEPLVQNGTFHLPTFKKVINRYWSEADKTIVDFNSARSPVALARAKQSSMIGKAVPIPEDEAKRCMSPGTVKRFVANIENAVLERKLVDVNGILDHEALEEMIREEMDKALCDYTDSVEIGRESIGEVFDNFEEESPFPSTDSDFFSVIRKNYGKFPDKSVVSELTIESPRRDIRKLFNQTENRETQENTGAERTAVTNITGAVTNKVGGLFSRLFQKDDCSVQRKDDLKAVAAYRRKKDERRLSDDTSSMSSFRALPDGIKNVVMGLRRISGAGSEREGKSFEDSVDEQVSSESETFASIARSYASGGHSEFSPERVKSFHKRVMERSALLGGREIIDTDGSEASFDGVNPDVLASLLLSPTILTKRHQQAIRAIEKRNWEQVSYLISANPWLCEMTDVTTNQYLLHKLALYGGGESAIDQSSGDFTTVVRFPPAPVEVNIDMVRLFPSSVHKFDQDGNTPLHMAAAAANASMVEILGDRFPSGATVRNEDGLLPIHLVILACGSPRAVTYGDAPGSTALIRTMLNYFPASVAVPDDEGNLPIHTAASVLRGEVGVDVIHLLLDEAEHQLKDPSGARFRNKATFEDFDATSVETDPTEIPTDSSHDFDEVRQCTTVLNDAGETPLMSAIRSRAGWEVIDALVRGPGGQRAALIGDRYRNNALHLLVGREYQDAAAALSILKNAPETAHYRNEEGMLPIEVACMQMSASDMILAIVLVDLPIDLDSKEELVKVKEEQGSSWWYLNCESDDHFVNVVNEVVSMCTYAQVRELCFMEGHSGDTLISRATPKCRAALQKGLRFLGRFEFIGQSALFSDPSRGIKIFEAIDFGPTQSPFEMARRVILKCYANEATFLEESRIINEMPLDSTLFETISIYSVGEDGVLTNGPLRQFCISIERPQLTLAGVVSGMLGNEDCQTNVEVRSRYALKVFSVIRVVCKAVLSLHRAGLIHGNISLAHIGKYDGKWKVAEALGLQRIGETFDPDRFSPSSPPESVVPLQNPDSAHQVQFREDLVTAESIDVWALGKLAFEALVGEPLVMFDDTAEFDNDHTALMDLMHWNDFNLDEVADKLRKWSVTDAGIELVLSCLAPSPDARPSVEGILDHPLWKELRRNSR